MHVDPVALTAWATFLLVVVTVPLTVATVYLALAAWRQLPLIAAQARDAARSQRERDTLRACTVFDTDSVIFKATQRIWTAADGGTRYVGNEAISRHDVMVVANYLDGVAIGARDGFYDEAIVWAHLGPVMTKMVYMILPAIFGSTKDYETMASLHARLGGIVASEGEPDIVALRDAVPSDRRG
jgi:hypothetical protein